MKATVFKKLIKAQIDKSRQYSDIFEITGENMAVFTNGFFIVEVKIDEPMAVGIYSIETNLPVENRRLPDWRPLTAKRYSLTHYDNLLHIGNIIRDKGKKQSAIISLDGKVIDSGKGIKLTLLNLICDLGCSSLGVDEYDTILAATQERDIQIIGCLTK